MADPSNRDDKNLPALVSELWELVVRYAKQETVDPLKALGRFVGWGLGGAVCISIGCVVLSLALLRALQLELAPHLDGNWSWVPYGAVLVLAGLLIMLLARAIGADKRRAERERARLRLQKGKG